MYKVTAGKTKVTCSRKKATATKKAKSLRAAGKQKVRVVKVKSCAKKAPARKTRRCAKR